MHPNKPTLVVGASPNPTRFSFIATNMLLEYGHEVHLFGIRDGSINGCSIHKEWSFEGIDTVTLYVGPARQEPYYQPIIDLKPKRVIFNPGTENQNFVKLLNAAGIETMNACTLVLLRSNQY
jgi:predicted CoA-binding protein